jgi:hypothetical protein
VGTPFIDSEQARELAAKPIARMRWFASLLNWRGLQLEKLLFTSDEIERCNLPASRIVAFYMTTDWKFNLQINENPIGQCVTYQATIKADRYGIKNIGWHPFTLFADDGKLKDEVERLRPWFDRRLYKTRLWLREFKMQHLEMLLPSGKKHRGRLSPSLSSFDESQAAI